jgi:hypothetical protein
LLGTLTFWNNVRNRVFSSKKQKSEFKKNFFHNYSWCSSAQRNKDKKVLRNAYCSSYFVRKLVVRSLVNVSTLFKGRHSTQHSDSQHNGLNCDSQHKATMRNIPLSGLTMSFVGLSVTYFIVMLSIIIPRIVMLNVIMLTVIMLSAVASFGGCSFSTFFLKMPV